MGGYDGGCPVGRAGSALSMNVEGWPMERKIWSPKHFMEAFAVSRALAVALPPDGCISGPITIIL